MALRSRMGAWPVAAAVLAITAGVTAVIVLGIVLVAVEANSRNTLVNGVLDASRWLTQPFHEMVPQHNPKQDIAVNWGIAAVVYFVAGGIIARLVR